MPMKKMPGDYKKIRPKNPKAKKGGHWMRLNTDPPKYVYVDSDGNKSKPQRTKTKKKPSMMSPAARAIKDSMPKRKYPKK